MPEQKQTSREMLQEGILKQSRRGRVKISRQIHDGDDGSQWVLEINVCSNQTTYIAAHARPGRVGLPCQSDKRKPYFTPQKEERKQLGPDGQLALQSHRLRLVAGEALQCEETAQDGSWYLEVLPQGG